MDNSNKHEFAKAMYAVAELYDRKVSKELLAMYFNALADYSIEQVKSGISKHTLDPKHGSFFPKPADIVRHLQAQTISAEQKAELAWAQITREMRTSGSYGSLNLDDKQALAALKSFTSWKDLCMMPESSLTWAKKEFISMYSTYENTPLEMLPSSLPGREELLEHKQKSAGYLADLKQGMEDYKAKLDNKGN